MVKVQYNGLCRGNPVMQRLIHYSAVSVHLLFHSNLYILQVVKLSCALPVVYIALLHALIPSRYLLTVLHTDFPNWSIIPFKHVQPARNF